MTIEAATIGALIFFLTKSEIGGVLRLDAFVCHPAVA